MSGAERAAHNEATFREINEAIEAGIWKGDRDRAAFVCECGELGCNVVLEVTMETYERVRSDSRWFVIAPGHELTDIETVIERGDGYSVVEKRGEAGQVADATDPRED